jgi:hypothetical protein
LQDQLQKFNFVFFFLLKLIILIKKKQKIKKPRQQFCSKYFSLVEKEAGRVAFGIEVLKNELFLHLKVLGNYQKKFFTIIS